MARINYGIDAPKVIRNLIGIGLVVLLVVFVAPKIQLGNLNIDTSGFVWTGLSLIVTGLLMILYSKLGKFRHRERILNKITWNGDEKALDVGTGSGLLMIGAAKKLNTGTSYGIDIFDKKDLSHNSMERLQSNIQLENVSQNVQVLNENILNTEFPDGYFDVILSNLCLHNIPKSKNRKKACFEIYRILKPGGTVLLSDFIHIGKYRKNFEELGMMVHREGPYFLDTFPPLSILKAIKN